MKTFKIVNNDISDGYHTFDELYEHRCLLFINLVLALKGVNASAWKSDLDFGSWFCLYLETEYGQISYHIPNKFLFLVEPEIPQVDNYKWDGHSSATVIERLNMMAR